MYVKCTNLQNNHEHISANVYHVLFRTGEVIGIRASTITLKNDPIVQISFWFMLIRSDQGYKHDNNTICKSTSKWKE